MDISNYISEQQTNAAFKDYGIHICCGGSIMAKAIVAMVNNKYYYKPEKYSDTCSCSINKNDKCRFFVKLFFAQN